MADTKDGLPDAATWASRLRLGAAGQIGDLEWEADQARDLVATAAAMLQQTRARSEAILGTPDVPENLAKRLMAELHDREVGLASAIQNAETTREMLARIRQVAASEKLHNAAPTVSAATALEEQPGVVKETGHIEPAKRGGAFDVSLGRIFEEARGATSVATHVTEVGGVSPYRDADYALKREFEGGNSYGRPPVFAVVLAMLPPATLTATAIFLVTRAHVLVADALAVAALIMTGAVFVFHRGYEAIVKHSDRSHDDRVREYMTTILSDLYGNTVIPLGETRERLPNDRRRAFNAAVDMLLQRGEILVDGFNSIRLRRKGPTGSL